MMFHRNVVTYILARSRISKPDEANAEIVLLYLKSHMNNTMLKCQMNNMLFGRLEMVCSKHFYSSSLPLLVICVVLLKSVTIFKLTKFVTIDPDTPGYPYPRNGGNTRNF